MEVGGGEACLSPLGYNGGGVAGAPSLFVNEGGGEEAGASPPVCEEGGGVGSSPHLFSMEGGGWEEMEYCGVPEGAGLVARHRYPHQAAMRNLCCGCRAEEKR